MTDATGVLSARETLDRMVPLLRDGDMDRLVDLYAEDGVHELPFAPPGVPARIEGREQIRAYLTATPAGLQLSFQDFRPVAVRDTVDPDVIVAEYDVHGQVPSTGRRFTTRFCWVLTICDGQIRCWRDYWNPLEIFELQGLLPDLLSRLTTDAHD